MSPILNSTRHISSSVEADGPFKGRSALDLLKHRGRLQWQIASRHASRCLSGRLHCTCTRIPFYAYSVTFGFSPHPSPRTRPTTRPIDNGGNDSPVRWTPDPVRCTLTSALDKPRAETSAAVCSSRRVLRKSHVARRSCWGRSQSERTRACATPSPVAEAGVRWERSTRCSLPGGSQCGGGTSYAFPDAQGSLSVQS